MSRMRSFSTVSIAMWFLAAVLCIVKSPAMALAQHNITDDQVSDLSTSEFCIEGDDCTVESVATLLDSTSIVTVYTYNGTYISMDLEDDDYSAYETGSLTQDDTQINSFTATDDGKGNAEYDGTTSINLQNGPYAYALTTNSYLVDICSDTAYSILTTEADATIGAPEIKSVSPAYVFVGTNGSLTINGSNFLSDFGNESTVGSTKNGGTGFSLNGTVNSDTEATANYTATLTATTGPWAIGITHALGGSYEQGTFGGFTVGDPPPTISSVSPNQWSAGQTNTQVTISGSGFGSNPQLSISGAGASGTISSSSDSGGSGAATITANVSVDAASPGGTATITVTSQGYNGSSFTAAYSGEESSASSSATVYCGSPTISNVQPTPWTAGQTYNITITGTGFCSDSVPSVSVATGSVSISNYSVVNSTTMTATVQPSGTDPSETATLTISTTADSTDTIGSKVRQTGVRPNLTPPPGGGQTGGSATFYVQIIAVIENVYLINPILFENVYHTFNDSNLIMAAQSIASAQAANKTSDLQASGFVTDGTATAIAVYFSNTQEPVSFYYGQDSQCAGSSGFTFGTWTAGNSFLSSPPSGGACLPSVSMTPVPNGNNYYAIALVQAPDQSKVSANSFGIGLGEVQAVQQGYLPRATIGFDIVPVPVIMVHGLWAGASSLEETTTYLGGQAPWQKSPFTTAYASASAVTPVCYSQVIPFNATVDNVTISESGTLSGCEQTSWTALDKLLNDGKTSGSTEGSIQSQLDQHRYVGGRVDIVAHSMGGLAARYYSTMPQYLSERNRGQGAFRNVVTIDTPEYGSALASYLPYTFANQQQTQGAGVLWRLFCNDMSATATGEQCLYNRGMPLAAMSPAGPGTQSGILSGAVASLIPPNDPSANLSCNNAIRSLSTSGDTSGGNISHANWFAITSVFSDNTAPEPSLLRALLSGVLSSTNNPTSLPAQLAASGDSQGDDVIVNYVSQTGAADPNSAAAASAAHTMRFNNLQHAGVFKGWLPTINVGLLYADLPAISYDDDDVVHSPAVDSCVASILTTSTACNPAATPSVVRAALVQSTNETEQEAVERKKHPFKNAPGRMTVEAVSHDVPVATPLYLTVTMAPGKLVSKNLLSTLYVQQIGPRGEGVPGGSGPAKIVEDKGATKVIEVMPAQLGQVTFRLSSMYSDNAFATQDVQVHVNPIAQGLKTFTMGLPSLYAGIMEGDPGGEPLWLKPELRYEGMGTIYPDDLSAVKLTVEQSAGNPIIHVDDRGRLHLLRPGKATLIGDVAGVKCIISITVYTNDTYPQHKR